MNMKKMTKHTPHLTVQCSVLRTDNPASHLHNEFKMYVHFRRGR